LNYGGRILICLGELYINNKNIRSHTVGHNNYKFNIINKFQSIKTFNKINNNTILILNNLSKIEHI